MSTLPSWSLIQRKSHKTPLKTHHKSLKTPKTKQKKKNHKTKQRFFTKATDELPWEAAKHEKPCLAFLTNAQEYQAYRERFPSPPQKMLVDVLLLLHLLWQLILLLWLAFTNWFLAVAVLNVLLLLNLTVFCHILCRPPRYRW